MDDNSCKFDWFWQESQNRNAILVFILHSNIILLLYPSVELFENLIQILLWIAYFASFLFLEAVLVPVLPYLPYNSSTMQLELASVPSNENKDIPIPEVLANRIVSQSNLFLIYYLAGIVLMKKHC